MRLLKNKNSRLVLASGVLLAALSVYGAGDSSSQSGAVSANGASYFRAPRSIVRRARKDWRQLRLSIRQGTVRKEEVTAANKDVYELSLRTARLSGDHLEVRYTLPEPECMALWMTAAGNQEFQRLNVIGGMPCSTNSGELSAQLRIDSIQPAVVEGQLVQICNNARQRCSQPIAVTSQDGTHGAAQETITIHSATVARNAYLSVTYSKGEGCMSLVRWNGPGDLQKVSSENDPFTCDTANHATARVNIRGMEPLLGPTQWIMLCAEEDTTHCSNAYRIR